jgi:hypothetical protein
MAAAKYLVGDHPGVEIWCEQRKVVTCSRDEAAQLQLPVARSTPSRAAMLVSRNKRLLQQAAAANRRTEALRARLTAQRHSDWATLTWPHTPNSRERCD